MEREIIIPSEIYGDFRTRMEGALSYRKNEQKYLETLYYGADVKLPYDDDPQSFELYGNIGSLIDSTFSSVYLQRMQTEQGNSHLRIGGSNGEYLLGKQYRFDPALHFSSQNPYEPIPRTNELMVITATQIATFINNEEIILLPEVLSTTKTGIAKEMTLLLQKETSPRSTHQLEE